MRTLAIISAMSMLFASSAAASTISDTPYYEMEGNDTVPAALLANFVGAFSAPGGAFLADGCVSPGDVDYYAFSVPGLTHLVAAVYALPNSELSPLGPGHDSIMQLVTAAGVSLEDDDDDNIGFMSSLETSPDIGGGVYLIGITGYADYDFDGIDDFSLTPHDQDFCYKLIVGVNTIPEPSTIALLAGGLLLGLRRRVR